MGNTINYLSAAQARELTDNCTFLKNSVYKWIKQECERCNSIFRLYQLDYDEKALNVVIMQLIEDGYHVEFDDEEKTYVITW